jgi:hypothetical protein
LEEVLRKFSASSQSSQKFDGKNLKEIRLKVRALLALMMTDHFDVLLLTVGWKKSGVLLRCFRRAFLAGRKVVLLV